MAKYRKRPIEVEATQWFKMGDHPAVEDWRDEDGRLTIEICSVCNQPLCHHGTIKTLEGRHIVCIKDWIITGIQGEHYPCKPDIFEATYEAVSTPDTIFTVEETFRIEEPMDTTDCMTWP